MNPLFNIANKSAHYIRDALFLVFQGEWSEFVFRSRVLIQKIDLKNTYLEELNLSPERSHYHANSGGLHLEKVLRALKITSQDSVLDFGAGKGGALITMHRYPFAKIAGVEISQKLVDIAEANFNKLNISNISMTVSDAADFTDLADYNYFYFFSPFPSVVMKTVIANISASLACKPRRATIVYFNPVYHDDVITDSPFIKSTEFNHHKHSYFIYTNAS